jgi:pantothenate synthetase
MNDTIAIIQAYDVILQILQVIDIDTWWLINIERLDYALSNQNVYVLQTELKNYQVWVRGLEDAKEYYPSGQEAYTEAVKLAMQRLSNAD